MLPEMQCAINLLSFAANALSRQVDAMGHDTVVEFLRFVVEDTEGENVVIALSEMVLAQLTERVVDLVASGSVSQETLFELLEGQEGHTLAFQTLFRVLKQMPLWSQRPVAH
jgi:hypothetical protein